MQAAVSTVARFTAHPGFIRRFCGCGSQNVCRCGLPRARSGWTVQGLTEIHLLMREHLSAVTVAELTGRSLHEVNVGLDFLIGRTPAHALAAIEARLQRGPTAIPQETGGEPAAILRNGRWETAS